MLIIILINLFSPCLKNVLQLDDLIQKYILINKFQTSAPQFQEEANINMDGNILSNGSKASLM